MSREKVTTLPVHPVCFSSSPPARHTRESRWCVEEVFSLSLATGCPGRQGARAPGRVGHRRLDASSCATMMRGKMWTWRQDRWDIQEHGRLGNHYLDHTTPKEVQEESDQPSEDRPHKTEGTVSYLLTQKLYADNVSGNNRNLV